MTKRWNRTWNVDVVGILRGRYWTPALGIKLGETAIRNCFRDQHAAMRQEGLDNLGNHPCIMTEFGIPYDMDDKHAYKTGDYTSQSSAMDANHFAVEASGLEGYTLWLYMAQVCTLLPCKSSKRLTRLQNDHERGDQWNGEDLSIFSLDDKALPVSPLPPSPEPHANASANDLLAPGPPSPTPSSIRKDVDSETGVTPANLRRSMTNASISSSAPQPSGTPGYRAAEAFVRPAPIVVAGTISSYHFDLKKCEFNMTLQAAQEADKDAPTALFLPEYHFPKDGCTVEVSSGKWEISSDEEEGPLIQRLRWWHGDGEQRIRVTGLVRRYNASEGDDDGGYYEALGRGIGSCSVM
jgi:hypothetical protein